MSFFSVGHFEFFFFASFSCKMAKVSWLARMGQNFDQAKCDNTFWPRPNILTGSVCSMHSYSTKNSSTKFCTRNGFYRRWHTHLRTSFLLYCQASLINPAQKTQNHRIHKYCQLSLWIILKGHFLFQHSLHYVQPFSLYSTTKFCARTSTWLWFIVLKMKTPTYTPFSPTRELPHTRRLRL